MNLESLVITKDPDLIGVLRSVLEKIAVNVQACPDLLVAASVLEKNKLDAVIVDCDDLPHGVELLKSIRTTRSNASSVAFAVLNGKTSTQQAFPFGANFVLQKPLTPLNATRCFNAALNFMVRERRRYFRHPLEVPVRVVAAGKREVTATSTNLSEGGISIHCASQFARESALRLRFSLPQSNVTLELKAVVAWSDGSGKIGLRFVEVPQSSQYQLDKWLTDRTKNDLPEALQEYIPAH
jgi:DNA-binding response OmpR family regulator